MTSTMASEERNGTGEQTAMGRATTRVADRAADVTAQVRITTADTAVFVAHAPAASAASRRGAFGRLAWSRVNEVPRAVCFPRDDREFAERVQMLFEGSHPERPFAAAVQALLRETYPLAVISPRHELAALDGRKMWYAFRDGSAVPDVDGDT